MEIWPRARRKAAFLGASPVEERLRGRLLLLRQQTDLHEDHPRPAAQSAAARFA